ncbi:beta-sandwich domain-containing protein [Bdellovibrio bacteriovorus]|uniref:beta-sandwich domain-containing protein n=1 Tax=Bdellovibrio bacteriovorus TaxID=959 RepID=UPI0035A82923
MSLKFFSKVLILALLATQGVNAAELPKPPGPPNNPNPPPAESVYEGVGRVDQVTRQTGGEIYRLDLTRPLPLVRIEAKSKMGRLKIYSTTLVTDKNDRVPVRQLSGVSVDEPSPATSSELITVPAGIAAIEILAEAMGGEAALEIKAFSTKEAPKLSLGSRIPDFSCKKNNDALLKDKLEPVQLWVGRAEAAAPGSVQEKFAGNQLKDQVADYVATLRAGGSYTSTAYLLTLLNFFADQYNAVRAGGVSEPAYRDLLNGTYNVLMLAIQNELPCRRFSSDTLIQISMDLNKKHQGMTEGSRARALYATMMTKIRDTVPGQYRKEIAAANWNFRQADAEGTNYYKLYISAKDDSFLKNTHRDMSAYAYMIAEQALAKEVKLMDIEQRYQLIVEYQAKYNANTDFPQAVAARYLAILSDQNYYLPFMRY